MLRDITLQQLETILLSKVEKQRLLEQIEDEPIKEILSRSNGYSADADHQPYHRWGNIPWDEAVEIAFKYQCTAEYYFNDFLDVYFFRIFKLFNLYIRRFGPTLFIMGGYNMNYD